MAQTTIVTGFTSRNNGLTKGTAKHLNIHGKKLTKRIIDKGKRKGLSAAFRELKPACKYYFSQTYTLFYKELLDDAKSQINDIFSDAFNTVVKRKLSW